MIHAIRGGVKFVRGGRLLTAGALLALFGCSASNNDPQKAGTGGVYVGTGGAVASGGGAGGILPETGGSAFGSLGGGLGTGGGGVAPLPDGGATRTKVTLDECANPAGGLSAADAQRLMAGGAPGDFKLVYPYEGTVFPRGLISPLVIWQGSQPQFVYVHITSHLLDYKGCFPAAGGEFQLPQQVWDTAGVQTEGENDPFTIEVSVLDGGAVKGPATRKVTIAQATLKGSIFYDSYNSPKAGFSGGAVLRVIPGKEAELFARQGVCTGCHTVSRNGSRLIAREIGGLADGSVYALTPTTAANPPPLRGGASSAFVGLSPDGSVYVSTAVINGIGPRVNGAIPVLGSVNAQLFETDTGNVVADTGIPGTAMMPTFSADGSLLVFNDFAIANGHGLATMKYDPATKKATAYKKLVETGQVYAGWPFYLPDNGGVVFSQTASGDFSGGGAGIAPVAGPASDLAMVDTSTGTAFVLARAMGFDTAADFTAGKTYLPLGTQELHQNYYPTVSPVSAGGYFWVFFDSIRSYGSLGISRQLWGTALTVSADGKYAADPSHPAFYLSGQERGTANHRAFTALDPCKKDGDSCDTGVDCCSGFCTNHVCGIPETPRCSELGETCKTSADCCNTRHSCIGGFCSVVLQ